MDKDMLKMVATLGIIAVVVALALANVYKVTRPLIEANKRRVIKEAMKEVLPKAKSYNQKKVKGVVVYTGLDNSGQKVGYAFIAEGSGYQDKIIIMAGANKDLSKLTGISIMEQKETPGLGGRIGNKSFQKQFKGLSITSNIEYLKNKTPTKDNEIEAIMGATISSRSVVADLNKTLNKIRKELKNG